MSTLSERVVVHCPMNQAKALLEQFFADRAEPVPELKHRHAVRLKLRAPLHMPMTDGDMTPQSDVIATLTPVPAPEYAVSKMAVSWEPVSGPYPSFDGGIIVESDEDYELFRLVLKGTYEPPGGPAGKLFDALVGQRIASATARDLLERIRESIEASHAAIEAAKPSAGSGDVPEATRS